MDEKLICVDGVIEPGSNAAREDLIEITIPGDIKEVGDHAFEGCLNLKKVTVEEGVEIIGEAAFANCPSLKRISLPASLNEIGDYLCRDCPNLTKITFAGTSKQLKKAASKLYSWCYPKNRTVSCSDMSLKVTPPAYFKKKLKAEYGD